MIRPAARFALAALLLGSAVADAQPGNFTLQGVTPGGMMLGPTADPSAVVAAEIAFAQLSRDKGQWTGFRKTADTDAVMFVPGIVNAQRWLKSQKDPAKSVVWSPERVLMSCDGTYGVAHGRAEWPDGRKNGYVTIWRRQQDGSYKWMLDWSTALPKGADDGIDGKIAECPPRRGPGAGAGPDGGRPPVRREEMRRMEKAFRESWKKDVVRIADPPPATGEGQSRDGSLRWQWTVAADGARSLKVSARYDGAERAFIDDRFAAGE